MIAESIEKRYETGPEDCNLSDRGEGRDGEGGGESDKPAERVSILAIKRGTLHLSPYNKFLCVKFGFLRKSVYICKQKQKISKI